MPAGDAIGCVVAIIKTELRIKFILNRMHWMVLFGQIVFIFVSPSEMKYNLINIYLIRFNQPTIDQ